LLLLESVRKCEDIMLERESLQDLLDRIGAATPTSGSGAAAAVTLGIGIACLRKAIAVSLKTDTGHSELHAAEQRLVTLADQALAAAIADERGFPRLLAADGKGKGAQRSATAADLVALGQRFQELCRAVEAEANDLDDLVDPVMVNDLLAARLLSRASATIAKANAAENATLI
jgi:formiminotetrahydrofolate cyclodeaminase